MAKPEALTISEVAAKYPISRLSLYKKCSRSFQKKEGLVYVNGVGWFSIAKPGKEYVLYLVTADGVSDRMLKKELESNIADLFKVIDGLVCSDCIEPMNQLKRRILSEKQKK